MKKYLIILLNIFILSNTYAQLTLQYKPCPNGTCPTNVNVLDWQTNHVYSDFGMRAGFTTDSRWHRGVDFNITGTGISASFDYGFHLITPVNGIIAKVDGYGYKILSIQDASGNNYHLGYGHIFNNNNYYNNAIEVGDFVLYRYWNTSINNYTYVIINKTTNVAISEIDGYSFTYNGHPYITTNQVTAGQSIAPLGKSGYVSGTTSFSPHLHLYRFENPYATYLQDKVNCKDPLQILNIINTNYEFEIKTNNITETGNNTFYSGANKSIVKVRCEMINPGQQGSYGNHYYTNAIMDIDDVDLKIKKVSEPTSAFHLIHGVNYLSKISHGARWSGSPYPNTAPDQIREHYGVYSSNANNCIIGIIPSAYSSHPWDEFVFTDIYTRIHKDHNLNGTLTLANNPDEALYPDGEYNLAVQITTVKGQQQDNFNTPTEILIDNFRPYIKKVEVSDLYGMFYTSEWKAFGNQIKNYTPYSDPGSGNSLTGSGINTTVAVTTSEPMADISLSIVDNNGNTSTAYLQSHNTENTSFVFSIDNTFLSNAGEYQLNFTGHDMAQNPLEAISKSPFIAPLGYTQTYHQLYTIPIRQSNTVWSPLPHPGTDTFHKIKIGCSAGNKSTNNTESSPCLSANFTMDKEVAAVGETVTFTDASYGNPLGFFWDFGDGYTNDQDLTTVTHSFSSVGTYNVRLQVNEGPNLSGDLSLITKQINIITTSSTLPYADFYLPTTAEVGQVINIVDQSYNSPDSWHWEFSNSLPDVYQQNPQNIVFYTPGTYSVTLTVTNQYGTDTKTKTILIQDLSNTTSSNVICDAFPEHINPGQSTSISVSLENAPYNPYSNYIYQIDYGDGTNEQINSNQVYNSFFHTYNSSGIFDVNVTVLNSLNQQIGNCTSTVNVYDVTQPIQATINMDPAIPQLGSNITFTPNTNAYGDDIHYEWHYYYYGFGTYEEVPGTFSFDEIYNATAFVSNMYKVTLDVSDNTGRQPGHDEIVYYIEQPITCIVAAADLSYNSELGNAGNEIVIKTNCFFNTNECDAPSPLQGIVTDIRLTLLNKWHSPRQFHHTDYNDPDFQVFNTGVSGWDYYYISIEAWNRYYQGYEDGANTFDPGDWDCIGGTNPYNYNYYDKVGYKISLDCGGNNKYICGDIDNDKTYDNEYKIFAANHNNCSNTIKSGNTVVYEAVKEITLRKGFTAEEGSDFTAKLIAKDCAHVTLPIHYSKAKNLINKSDTVKISIFPNPNNGKFNVIINDDTKNSTTLSYDIYNSLGNKIKSLSNIKTKKFMIDISDCPKSLYYIRFYYKNNLYTKKILLTK